MSTINRGKERKCADSCNGRNPEHAIQNSTSAFTYHGGLEVKGKVSQNTTSCVLTYFAFYFIVTDITGMPQLKMVALIFAADNKQRIFKAISCHHHPE